MKLIFILCTAVLLNVKAASYAQKINLSVKDAPLETVFDQISKQSGYNFLYTRQMLQSVKPVSISVRNNSVEEVLALCFKGQPITYTLTQKTVIIKSKTESIFPNSAVPRENDLLFSSGARVENIKLSRPITGTALDKVTKETLPGVIVKVKGGTATAVTDVNGKFSINANTGDVLVASYIGYVTQELTVGAGESLNFTLLTSLNNLDEIVVVGYGTQAKRDVTGAITSVSSRQIMERSPVNIYEALQGQSPGVQVNQSSGDPSAGSSVIIRGIGTFGAGAGPLYIVDGAQGVNIDGINPMDVQSIDILKDAASASIYGARGANGVIIITTKRGQSGKSELSTNLVSSFGTLSHKIASSNADERRLYEIKRAAGTGTLPADSLNPGFNADVDALDAVTRTAKKLDATVTLSGGSPTLRYLASMNYVSDESIILNSWAKQARFRVNTDFSPSEKFKFSSNLTFGLRNGNRVLESSTLNEAYSRNPTFALYLPDGSLAPTISGRQNPVAWALLYKNMAKNYSGSLYNKLDFNVIKDLVWSADATLNYGTGHTFQFTPNSLAGAGVAVNTGTDRSTVNTGWLTQTYLNYNKSLGSNHVLTGVAGASAERRFGSDFRLTGNTFVTDEVLTLNSAQSYGNPTNSETANTMVSAWGRVGYNFKKRYQINATLRADGSSRFGAANRWGYFPSAGANWNFSEEPIFAGLSKYLTSGKIRASYGVTGNDQSLGDYDAIHQYTFGSNFYNGVSGVVLNSSVGNPNLSWEVNKNVNVGTDLSFLEGRLNITADYYVKRTEKLLYRAPLVLESGFSSINVNTGSIENRGVDLMIEGYPVRSNKFSWNASYIMSFNKGKVLELVNHTSILQGAGSLTREGQPLGDFFGWRQLGVFAYDQSNAFDASWNRLTPNFSGTTFTGYTLNGQAYSGTVNRKRSNGVIALGGDVDWEDLDKNGIIDDQDRSVLGNAQPDWTAGLSNTFNYKDFSLAVVFYGSIGGNIYNMIDARQSNFSGTGITPRPYIIYNAWSKQGDVTDVPAARTSAIGNTREIGSRYVEDASFVRLRNVKFSYSMPTKLASFIGARRVLMSVSGNNLLTWSKYLGFDPEFALDNPLQLGVESTSRVPRKRELLLGLNVTF